MSRGPGKWQRALLEAVYENPTIAPSGRKYVHVRSWLRDSLDRTPTPSEYSAVHRAARKLVEAGKVKSSHPTFVVDIEPLN